MNGSRYDRKKRQERRKRNAKIRDVITIIASVIVVLIGAYNICTVEAKELPEDFHFNIIEMKNVKANSIFEMKNLLHMLQEFQNNSEIASKIKTESKLETEFESKTESKFETEFESKTESKFETESESEIESELNTETETKSEIEPESEKETETEIETEVESETEIETEVESETEIETEAESETEIETETESEPESELESESEFESESETEIETEYLGEFMITAYCACAQCCGKSDGITASGAYVQEGYTIAVDPSVISLGTLVMIDGHTYEAQDTGVLGNHIDIYMESHWDALQWGIQYKDVYLVK